MITVNLISFTAAKADYGPTMTAIGIGHIGPGPMDTPAVTPPGLVIPWQLVQKSPDILSLLGWHTRLSEFVGCKDALHDLEQWADSDHAISVKLVSGEGGVGKSRLAAEFAMKLQARGWSAGFMDLRNSRHFPLAKTGTLLIVDYPEEHRAGVAELLGDLRSLGDGARLRILFVTRQSYDSWRDLVADCHAEAWVDTNEVKLGRLDSAATHVLFCTAQKAAGEILKSAPTAVSESELAAWLQKAPGGDRPLFVVALAVHRALHPEGKELRHTGREVLQGLVEREVARLRPIAHSLGIKDRDAFARLLAIAAIARALPAGRIEVLARDETLHLGLDADGDLETKLQDAGMLIDRAVRAPKPNILAAVLVVCVLRKQPETAPELVWAALKEDLEGGLERLARLSHDSEIALGIDTHRIREWLARALTGKPGRCVLARPAMFDKEAPLAWVEAAIAVGATLLTQDMEQEEKASLLNNLSIHLANSGANKKALEAIEEAVAVRRFLAGASPAQYEPDLAMSLTNLSNSLRAEGRLQQSLAVIREAVGLYSKLAEKDPAHYEPYLAASLDNLSMSLDALGDFEGALAANQGAVARYRHLADLAPQRYAPDLAASLLNASNRFDAVGDTNAGLSVGQEAVARYRHLADIAPYRYEPDLAASLNNLSNRLDAVGDTRGSLAVITEAVEIRQRLAAASPARYEPDLAKSLNNLSNRQAVMGDAHSALGSSQDAVARYRRLAQATPNIYEMDLAGSLNNLAIRLADVSDAPGALAAIEEAIAIRRRLVERTPARHEPDLAESLCLLAIRLIEAGNITGSLEAIEEAIARYRRVSSCLPARHTLSLARCLGVLGEIMMRLTRTTDAASVFAECLQILRPYAKASPQGAHTLDVISGLEEGLLRARGGPA